MLTKGYQPPNITFNFDEEGHSREPEPRIPGKHALNAPIVTVLGAGIAGLTAAHELVERGFRVQVVEAKEDPYHPGEPMIGGMAANQAARVRANIEDLHREVIDVAFKNHPAAPKKDEKPSQEYSDWQASKEYAEWNVAVWLLEMFSFNRSAWIQTEKPIPLRRWIRADFNQAERKRLEDHGKNVADEIKQLEIARQNVVAMLLGEVSRFRERWLWDLTWRGVLCGKIHDGAHNPLIKEAGDAFAALLEIADDPVAMARKIATYQNPRKVPKPEQIDANKDTVRRAFLREFLCIRVTPSTDNPKAIDFAKKLAADLGDHAELNVDDLSRESGRTRPASPGVFLEVIEQRLPAEHGFHFFPTFYRHVEDTLRRIPVRAGGLDIGRTVLDGLKPTVRQGMGFSEADFDEMVNTEGGERPPDFKDDYLSRAKARAKAKAKADGEPKGGHVVDLLRDRPTSIEGFRDRNERFVARLGGTKRDSIWLFAKLFRYMTSCPERRRKQYEDISWEKFLDSEKFSQPMRHQITAAAQALLAFSSGEADARSYGNVAIQMLLDGLSDGSRVDRTLDGPLSEAWMNPWKDYLEGQGVRFFRATVQSLKFHPEVRTEHRDVERFVPAKEVVPVFEKVPPGLLTHEAPDESQRPDFYVMALNIEKALDLVKGLRVAAEKIGLSFDHKVTVKKVKKPLARDFEALLKFGYEIDNPQYDSKTEPRPEALKDMTGLQYFFEAKTSIGHGHMYFPYTKWGLSSISQSEFWCDPGSFSDGYLGVLSVGICDTKKPTTCDTVIGKVGPLSFWDIMRHPGEDETTKVPPSEVDRRRFLAAWIVWHELRARIDSKDDLAEPRCFHVDQDIGPAGNAAKFLASLNKIKSPRPGTRDGVGDDEIDYSLNFDRWVLAGTYMATHTRVTTMESANESGRHAARTILQALGQIDAFETKGQVGTTEIRIQSLKNTIYNGAAEGHSFDFPDIFNVEELELEDLEFFRRVDRRLESLGLKHFLDIIDFDRKLLHALDAVEIYKGQPIKDFLGLSLANLDAALATNLGQDYYDRLDKRYNDAKGSLPTLAGDLKDPPFGDMQKELLRLKKILDLF